MLRIKQQKQPRYPLPIGEAAKLIGVSPSQLRVYEMQGIVSPLRHGFRDMRWYLPEHVQQIIKHREQRGKKR